MTFDLGRVTTYISDTSIRDTIAVTFDLGRVTTNYLTFELRINLIAVTFDLGRVTTLIGILQLDR